MKSYKSRVLSALAWAVPALAVAVPRHESVAHPEARPPLLELDLQESYAQATFSVPCAGCLGQNEPSQDDDALVLSFKTHSSEEPCGSSNITLNGVYLPQEWSGLSSTGSATFSSVPDVEENAWFLQHDLDLEWESTCLQSNDTKQEVTSDDAAQVLVVTIKGVDGTPLKTPAGFTLSFKQSSPPELLRLERRPNRSAKDQANAESWREPPSNLRLILPSAHERLPHGDRPSQARLEDDIRELRALQAEVQELHRAIHHKKQQIKFQLKGEAHDLKQELRECDSITCVVRTIAHKAHGAWRILYIRFRPVDHHTHPPHPPHHGHEMGFPNDPYAQVWRAGGHKHNPEATMKMDSLPPPPPHDDHRPPPPFEEHPPPPPPHDGPPPPHHHEGPPPPHGGPPPPPHGGPPPPHGPHHGGPHGPHGPHHFEPTAVLGLKVLIAALGCGCLFAFVRRRCTTLEKRTERAARREERRNVRAYRCAARRHAWRKWWSRGWRDQDRIDDYEEKRSLIQHQESILEEAMQEEIRQLRNAHTVVNSLVHAPQVEEGRMHLNCNPHVHCHCHHYGAPSSPASSVYTSNSLAELPSRPLSRTSSLPGYHSDTVSEPPAYEEDESRSDIVANGFRQYTPSSSSGSSRWTPDSSVIDVSPRPSAETLRYAELTDTGVGDVKN